MNVKIFDKPVVNPKSMASSTTTTKSSTTSTTTISSKNTVKAVNMPIEDENDLHEPVSDDLKPTAVTSDSENTAEEWWDLPQPNEDFPSNVVLTSSRDRTIQNSSSSLKCHNLFLLLLLFIIL